MIRDVATGTTIPVDLLTARRHALKLDEEVTARRQALEEEGLDGLVPVDRILALIGGMIGGALAIAAIGILGTRRPSR